MTEQLSIVEHRDRCGDDSAFISRCLDGHYGPEARDAANGAATAFQSMPIDDSPGPVADMIVDEVAGQDGEHQ